MIQPQWLSAAIGAWWATEPSAAAVAAAGLRSAPRPVKWGQPDLGTALAPKHGPDYRRPSPLARAEPRRALGQMAAVGSLGVVSLGVARAMRVVIIFEDDVSAYERHVRTACRTNFALVLHV